MDLYKFNETLTRLFKHTFLTGSKSSNTSRNSQISLKTSEEKEETISALDYNSVQRTDCTLLLSTLIKVLIIKLTRLNELLLIPSKKISPIETKLLDDVLTKNISQRILQPYHGLLLSMAHGHISSIF